jgi:hypothetical protein
MPNTRRQNNTLHRTLKALPRIDLDELAVDYGIDPRQQRLDIEYALLAQQHHYIERKALARLRKAIERERAA